ncbi:hypothetical protein FSP39_017960 [Pinctada imbricata]|uniref:L-Fucosyltransferase n=1 Tax=Pinctada imbricata TaxID=66713 RepID=A0AA88XST0_PINIB|nr:hypothetical protein FSP39_017960 [Pinctada imbricata]
MYENDNAYQFESIGSSSRALHYLPFLSKSIGNSSSNLRKRKKTTLSSRILKNYTGYTYLQQLPVFFLKDHIFNLSRYSFIGSSKTGRIGNQLFEFASGYGMARQTNRIPVIGHTDRLRTIFNITNAILVNRNQQIKKWNLILERKCCAFDSSMLKRIVGKKNYRVGYYLQSWKYFERVMNELRGQLRFLSHIQRKADEIINSISRKYTCTTCTGDSGNLTYIGIHIRRGDMHRLRKFRDYGYLTAPASYIYRAIQYYVKNIARPVFIVCSDDMPWAQGILKNIRSDINSEFVHGKSEVDLAVQASCNHNIITVGTFGWWAGFLAGGDVIYYKHPFRQGSRLQRGYSKNMEDYFLPHWIPLE